MDEDREFYTLHLPNLIGYVVPILQSKPGEINIGSGVLVNVNGRHFIATAKHCIKGDIRVMRDEGKPRKAGTTGARELRIIDRGWHDDLDLGYLEVADPQCAELGYDQLSNERIVQGMVQFVGYPQVLVQPIKSSSGKLTNVSLAAGTFATGLTEETEDKMTFGYPKTGMKYDDATGTWTESSWPATPKGFSGGACFGVTKSIGPIAQVGYKLLAIEYAWNERDSVFAVPIKRWCELMASRGLV